MLTIFKILNVFPFCIVSKKERKKNRNLIKLVNGGIDVEEGKRLRSDSYKENYT